MTSRQANRRRPWDGGRCWWAGVAAGFFLAGCSPARPAPPVSTAPPPTSFSHADFDAVLKSHVNADGLVDYAALQRKPERFGRYCEQLAAISPDSHPDLFPDQASKLAYWVNAYNASVIETVLEYYPLRSVKDVRAPFPIPFFNDLAGFFYFQKVTLGGRSFNLRDLENEVIRERFGDPRIHFAINCASLGCPKLRAAAYLPEKLDGQLDDAAARFFAEPRNLRVDNEKHVVYVSSILTWYESDFTTWYANRFPDKEATLLNYMVLYVDEKRAEELRWAQGTEGYRVEFVEYDWRLNGQ